MKSQLNPDEYYKQLAKVPTSGGAFFRNKKGEFLIVKNHYQDAYAIIGGVTEKNETPREAVIREVKEELGIEMKQARLFCVDSAMSEPFDKILFVFDGGILDDHTIQKIIPNQDEIEKFIFVTYEKMLQIIEPKFRKRTVNSIEAFHNKGFVYLENGEPIK